MTAADSSALPGARVRLLSWMRLACLPAVAASAALAIEYRSRVPSFCSADSGCGVLGRTELAHLWGLGPTLPEAGAAAYCLIFVLTLTRFASLGALLSILGGLGGAALLLSQVAHGTFCWLCVVVDTSALATAGLAAMLVRNQRGFWALAPGSSPGTGMLRPHAWIGLLVLSVLGPVLWPIAKPAPPVPAGVRAYYRSDRINVVEFSDFECPYCRRLHHDLKELLKPYAGRVNLVRLNMPLPRHPNARDAALAAICAESLGHGEALVDFLFTTDDLSPPAIYAEVTRLGMDGHAYHRCRESPETHKRLEHERQTVLDAGFEGLPTTYIGGQRIVGAGRPETFQDALERAARNEDHPGVPGWAYLLLLAAIAAGLIRTGLKSNPSTS